MKRMRALIMTVVAAGGMACSTASKSVEDPRGWLEEIESERALSWVRERNQRTLPALESDARYSSTEKAVREIVLAKDRIPMPSYRGGWVYNFWQDAKHVRGLWRRARIDEYRKPEPAWEVIIDLDELARKENENWVWKSASCLPPANDRCLITLSRGGKDASVVREYDIAKREFVAGGFSLPEAKSQVSWIDADTVFVATDFGPGSLTKSGYPRIVKVWKRGQKLEDSEQVFEAGVDDVAAGGHTSFRPEGNVSVLYRSPSFFEQESWLWRPGVAPVRIPLESDADVQGSFHGKIFALLRSDWSVGGKTFRRGSLVALPLDTLDVSRVEAVLEPDDRTAVLGVVFTRDRAVAVLLHEVRGKLVELAPGKDGKWSRKELPYPDHGTVSVVSTDPFENRMFSSYTSFLVPTTLYLSDGARAPEVIKRMPARFDASGLEVEQGFAKSKDGERIPYFMVRKKGLRRDGSSPTLLYGYGGFENAMTPSYLGALGKAWAEKGGTYVLANIRGGGEFGPRWHQAALKENRQKAFDDFIAVAEDLISRKITSPRRLGIMGGSNGGLLMGATFTQRPELFNAVVCQVPLLDMLRYTKLLAGASWAAEYGDPDDPKSREIIARYSPYHNLRADKKYPKVFFVTSTKDDRVHPGHARKMAARMEELGHPFLYFENIEGGHGAAANLEQEVKRRTVEYVYLYRQLMD